MDPSGFSGGEIVYDGTVMSLIEDYISYIRDVRRYSARTQTIYSDALTGYARFCDAGNDESLLESLNHQTIRSYEVFLMDSMNDCPRTVKLHMSVLSGFCRYLMKEKKLPSNPVRLVAKPKVEKRLPVFYREESMNEYFAVTDCDASEENLALITGTDKVSEAAYSRRLERLIVALLYDTGMRRAELIGLRICDVDFSRRTATARGKGDKVREIPLVSSLCKEISLYLQSVETMVGRARSADEPLLVTCKGLKLYPVFIDRAIKRALGRIGSITGRKSPHVLRHSLATELLDEGADLNSIKELLGHSSLAATQVYTHNTIEKLKKVYVNAHPRAKSGGKNGD
jgi:integrase/recombinase XerC